MSIPLLLSNFSPSEKDTNSLLEGHCKYYRSHLPKLNSALAGCGGVKVGIKLSKNEVHSLATDGSDFTLSQQSMTLFGATGFCSSRLIYSVVLTMSGALPGIYN
jgi:hypothetical protein